MLLPYRAPHQAPSRDSHNLSEGFQHCIIVLLVKDVLLQIAAARLSQITHRNTSKKWFCCISHLQGLDFRPNDRIDMSHLGMNHREESSLIHNSSAQRLGKSNIFVAYRVCGA
jgi:hypothetical protein